MRNLEQNEMNGVCGGSLASDVGNWVGGAVADAVDDVQQFANDVGDLVDAFVTRPRVPVAS